MKKIVIILFSLIIVAVGVLFFVRHQGSTTMYKVQFMDKDTVIIETEVAKGKKLPRPSNPEKEGYTFVNWYIKGTNEIYNFDSKVMNNLILDSKWDTSEYTVTFDANGGTVTEFSRKIKYQDSYGELPEPTRAGYAFSGWYTELNDGEQIDEESIFILLENQTLYAHWTEIKYVIKYNLNGGKATNPSGYNETTETFTLKNPTRSGYEFTGWTGTNLKELTKEVTIEKGTKGDLEYTANWKKTNTTPSVQTNYTITYNLNGGKAVNPTKYNNSTSTFKLNNPTRSGYEFTGWTGTNLKGLTKEVTIEKGTKGNLSYTANWSPVKYTITYNLNGGKATNPAGYSEETETFTLKNPTKSGYTFTGWTGTNISGLTKNVSIKKGTKGNLTYTANWKINKVILKYNVNGGVITSKNGYTADSKGNVMFNNAIMIEEYNYGSTLTQYGLVNYNNPAHLYVEKTGYIAEADNEWIASNGKKYSEVKVYNASDFCDAKNGDCEVTLKINWKEAKYTVNFNGNKFSTVNQTINGVTVSYNAASSELTLNGKATNGFGLMRLNEEKFVKGAKYKVDLTKVSGSYTSSGGTVYFVTEIKKKDGTDLPGGKDARNMLNLLFDKSGTLTISDVGASSGGQLFVWIWKSTDATLEFKNYKVKVNITKDESWKVTKGKKYSDGNSTSFPTPTRLGYKFNGWYTKETGGSRVLASDTVNITSNQTLYAQWIENKTENKPTSKTYTATFNKNGASSIGSTKLSCTVTSGTSCTVTAPKITPASGFGVVGWDTKADSTKSSVDVGKTITLSSNQTYYAVTKSSSSYKVVFVANALGYFNDDNGKHYVKDVKTVDYYKYNGNNYITIITLKAPNVVNTKTQTFIGWSTKENNPNPEYKANEIIKIDNPKPLPENKNVVGAYYASIKNIITVMFNKNGLDGLSSSKATCTCFGCSDCKLKYSDIPNIYSDGYVIEGFSTSANGNTKIGFDKKYSEDTTLYANANKDNKVSLSNKKDIGGVRIDIQNSSNIGSNVVDKVLKQMEEINKNMPLLFTGKTKFIFVDKDTLKKFSTNNYSYSIGKNGYTTNITLIGKEYKEIYIYYILENLAAGIINSYKSLMNSDLYNYKTVSDNFEKYSKMSSNNRPLYDAAYVDKFSFLQASFAHYYYNKYVSDTTLNNMKLPDDLIKMVEYLLKLYENSIK